MDKTGLKSNKKGVKLHFDLKLTKNGQNCMIKLTSSWTLTGPKITKNGRNWPQIIKTTSIEKPKVDQDWTKLNINCIFSEYEKWTKMA